MTAIEYPETQEHEGRHELHPDDYGTRRDAVTLYGWITNFVMPLPLRNEPSRHWNGRVA
ncbi:hypothetical protein [Amycolatopsis sp. CFH S0078]|uniref:hypothetical protein n=1 Tax=Amycolatopsis sp. CFH S0078 TaxID=1644108 RepID=UPI0014305F8C|nr:hypothetical protein [Amycolatopsis sp. CFH S0078]